MMAIGELFLAVAVGAAVAASVLCLRQPAWASRLLGLAAGAVAAATVRLAWAFVRSDFSIAYVADHSRTGIGALYRLAGLWGGLGGSLLFWVALLAVVGWVGTRRSAVPAALGIVAGLVGACTVVVWGLANPFATLDIPRFQGGGLTPILEHPAMVYHPPLLYLGLVATVVPFALVVGAAIGGGEPDRRAVRRWTAAAWTLLTIGLATGANWAYVELGWGGYWAWDPVENSALIPWLLLTAGLHWQHRGVGGPGRSGVAITAAPFVLVVYGALLTRSGATASVHAFAEQRSVGVALGALTSMLAAAAVVAIAKTTPAAAAASRTSVVAAALATIAATIVLVGTSVPIIGDWLGADERLIRGTFYSRLLAPIVLVALVAAMLAHAGSAGQRWQSAVVASGGAVLAMVVAVSADWGAATTLVLVSAAALGAMMLGRAITKPRVRVPVALGHLGFAVLLLGVAGTTAAAEQRVVLRPGEIVEVGGHRFEHVALDAATRGDLLGGTVTATIRVDDNVFFPSLTSFPDAGVLLAETSLASTWRDDVQVALRDANDNGQAEYDLAVRPLAMWVWWGAALLAAAGVAMLSARRLRPSYTSS